MRLPFEIRYRYTHLLPADVEIWDRFISNYPDFFSEVDYDFHVGEGVEISPSWTPEIAYMAKHLTQRRIDVVGYKPGEIWICEIKPFPGVTAIGQLLSYKTLFERDFPIEPTPIMALITNVISRDIQFLCDQFYIKV